MAKLEPDSFQEFRELEGKELPTGDWLSVTQDMINDFAKATMDFQWIHVDVEKAEKYSPFKKPVAHGFMSVSLLAKMLGDVIKVKSVQMGVNYGLNKVRFPAPVLVDSRLRLVSRISNIEEYGDTGLKITWNCTVEMEGSEKPACAAEFLSLMFE
ncbi:MaoC family dehydratase [Aggregatimonas sangjinii]|uniref:MaoC family dehydratase n=1 Tax=Aggregatimonas sangjinii TaxID=2583587 RepID=A0A5B7SVK0_9FLAO|nr:MaoC family dehydratase [Aggregatimonas sangjinii]QCX00870.1 MaoC family dehydratase [Aggregatimonas sangjinii]